MKSQLTPEEFISRVNHVGRNLTIENIIVTGHLVAFTQQNFLCSGIIIRNCEFEGDLTFRGLYAPTGIIIENCKIEGQFTLENISAPTYIKDRYTNDFLMINSTKVAKQVQIVNCIIDSNIQFDSNIEGQRNEIGSLFILNAITHVGGISIKATTIKNRFEIGSSNLNQELRIESSQIDSQVRITNVNCGHHVFLDANIEKDTWILGGEARNGISFNNGIYKDDFKIVGVKTNPVSTEQNKATPSLTFNGCKFEKYFILNYFNEANELEGGPPEIFIFATTFANALIVNDDTTRGYRKRYELNRIHIDASKHLKGELIFNDISIAHTIMGGANYEASIIFNNVTFQRLTLRSFSNYGKLQFVEVKATPDKRSRFSINNSFLGNAQFSSVNFKSFDYINIENSDVTQISTSSVTWFTEENINGNRLKGWKLFKFIMKTGARKIEETQKDYESRRELFRQLKFAMEKQGDRIQSLVFKQYEMEAFKKELQLKSKWYLPNQEKFILWINQLNNHGQSWIKPAILAVATTILFYGLIVISQSPQFDFRPNLSKERVTKTILLLTENKRMALLLLNPAHNIKELFKEHKELLGYVSGYTYLIDCIQRIVLSIFIFQTILAFRKYSK